MTKTVLASNNKGKLKEFAEMFGALGIEVVPQAEFDIPEADETGLTFVENAILKARNAAQHSGGPAFADDSGLEVDALKGAPGIYSSRYAGPECNDADNIVKLLEALKDIPEEQRTARFQCVIVYMRHAEDPTPLIAQGAWEGRILEEPQGENGFGYDPLFYVPEHSCSAAELSAEIKNGMSHRGKALKVLMRSFT